MAIQRRCMLWSARRVIEANLASSSAVWAISMQHPASEVRRKPLLLGTGVIIALAAAHFIASGWPLPGDGEPLLRRYTLRPGCTRPCPAR